MPVAADPEEVAGIVNNFCDFKFAFLDVRDLLKRGSTFEEKNLIQSSR